MDAQKGGESTEFHIYDRCSTQITGVLLQGSPHNCHVMNYMAEQVFGKRSAYKRGNAKIRFLAHSLPKKRKRLDSFIVGKHF